MNREKKVVCFIHCSYFNERCIEVLNHLINYLNTRNFFEKLDLLIINNIGTPLNERMFSTISNKIQIINYSDNLNHFETCTIKELCIFSKMNTDYKILYLHTKGVTHDSNKPIYNNVRDWVNYMLYNLVDGSNECLELLNTYDVIGCNYRNTGNPPHYSGNFWWANASYLKDIEIMKINDKYDSEFFLFKNNPTFINIHNCPVGHYENSYKLNQYEKQVNNRLKIFNENEKNFIYYCGIGVNGCGLCNQLFSLLNLMTEVYDNKGSKKLIILNDFCNDALEYKYSSVHEMLNIEETNKVLEKYGIILVYKDDIKLKIESCEYGDLHHKYTNITDDLVNKFLNNNKFVVDKNYDFNYFYDDPCPGVYKETVLKYSINGVQFMNIYDETGGCRYEDIVLDFSNINKDKWYHKNIISTYSRNNIGLFIEFLDSIIFSQKYFERVNKYISSDRDLELVLLYNTKKINCIHLRNEVDAINFWSGINGLNVEVFTDKLNNKYIDLINKYINKDDITVILSGKVKNNEVIDYMINNGYNIKFIEKSDDFGREENAIIDSLLLKRLCNNIFIGNHNPYTFNGSTYSFFLSGLLCNNSQIKHILVDLDKIQTNEVVL